MSKAESGGGEGVEIVKNEPYDDGERQGQYTHKVSAIESKKNPPRLTYRSLSLSAEHVSSCFSRVSEIGAGEICRREGSFSDKNGS